ncbi:hypothetical protein [Aulosira sp. FACHB-615]|uniref:hypothetical protein n=1 Tax=Aulosira sp. FACHB-615 TaxID=2692777 RepID=UPI001684B6F6|nr:hypothetical protein [Aulosira sp. FACHB-615]MBD2492539.1 hypothetical protein [Aulosira sp. FACHB-615]
MSYRWEPQSLRYRDTKTGRFLPQRAIASLIQLRISQVAQELQQLGDRLLSNQVTLKDWQLQTAQTLKILHTQQYMLGVGGDAQVQDSDLRAIAAELVNQYKYLQNFATDLTQERVSVAQFKVRLGMYASAAKVSYFRGEKEAAKRSGFNGAMRVLGDAEHCEDCPRYAALGAVPIDEVIYPTQECACRINCKCSLLWVKLEDAIKKPSSDRPLLEQIASQISELSSRQIKELIDDYKLSTNGSSEALKQRFLDFVSTKNQIQLSNISNYIQQVKARIS